LAHLIACIIVVASTSSTTSTDLAGVRISGYMQCVNGAFFLAGIPLVIIGGVGMVFRVEAQIRAYLVYLCVTVLVTSFWLGIFLIYGNACTTIQPRSGQYKKEALMVCQAGNGMAIFWMLVAVGLVVGAAYLVWSMLQYVRQREMNELLRYQEPWQAVTQLGDDYAAMEAKERFRQNQQMQAPIPSPYNLNQRYGTTQVPMQGWFNDPLKIQAPSDGI
jgi:hypothetical protein